MDNAIFLEFGLILVLAVAVSTILKLLRQPLIIGYIITGIIAGPQILDLFTGGETGELLSHFGVALLLFIIGIGLNPKVIKDVGKVAVLAGAGQVSITTALGYLVAKTMGFSGVEAFYIAFALAFSSTIIALKILSDKRETSRLYARIVIGILLIQDIIATILLILVAGSGQNEVGHLLQTAGYGLGLGIVLVLLGIFVLPRIEKFVSVSQEYLFLFALAWGFGIASLFSIAGLSIEVGALFAGVALATQTYAQEVSARLRPLRDFFVMLFFIILGAEMEISALEGTFLPVIGLSLLVLIGNPLIVMALMGFLGYTKKTSFKAGLTVAQISEFSLVLIILAAKLGRIDEQIVSMVTLVGLITIGASTYMMLFDETLYRWFEKYLVLFERRKIRVEQKTSHDADIFLFGYDHGARGLVSSFVKSQRKYLVIDYNPETIDELRQHGHPFAYGDVNDLEFLQELDLENVKMVISTMTDFPTNLFLTTQARAMNERAILIMHATHPEEAIQLYEHGATYVMMPHYIGTERIARMIDRHGLKKMDFVPSREKHLRYIEKHLS